MEKYAAFFRALGMQVKERRRERGYSQEDMIALGFSARHWQQIEAGRPITVTTLLRLCDALKVSLSDLVSASERAAPSAKRTGGRR